MWYNGPKLWLESFRLDVKKYLMQYLESWNLVPWMYLLAVAGSRPG